MPDTKYTEPLSFTVPSLPSKTPLRRRAIPSEAAISERSRLTRLEPLAKYFATGRAKGLCGFGMSELVGVTLGESGLASACGIAWCGSVWTCPTCAGKIAYQRARELASLFAWWRDGGVDHKFWEGRIEKLDEKLAEFPAKILEAQNRLDALRVDSNATPQQIGGAGRSVRAREKARERTKNELMAVRRTYGRLCMQEGGSYSPAEYGVIDPGVDRIDDETAGQRYIALVTLTVRHHKDETGDEVWDRIAGGWRQITSDRAYKAAIASGYLGGTVRVAETTYGSSGWHTHLHCAMLLDESCAPADEAFPELELEKTLWRCWRAGCIKAAGLTEEEAKCSPLVPTRAHGVDFQLVPTHDLKALAGYISKTTGQKGLSASLVAAAECEQGKLDLAAAKELTMSTGKEGKLGGRTPFQVLRDMQSVLDDCGVSVSSALGILMAVAEEESDSAGSITEAGTAAVEGRKTKKYCNFWDIRHGVRIGILAEKIADQQQRAQFVRDAHIWGEWLVMSAGRRQQTWSRGLKAAAGLTEISDEEVVEREDEALVASDGLLGGMAAYQWSEITSRPAEKARFFADVEALVETLDAGASEGDLMTALENYLGARGIRWHSPDVVRDKIKDAVLTKRAFAWLRAKKVHDFSALSDIELRYYAEEILKGLVFEEDGTLLVTYVSTLADARGWNDLECDDETGENPGVSLALDFLEDLAERTKADELTLEEKIALADLYAAEFEYSPTGLSHLSAADRRQVRLERVYGYTGRKKNLRVRPRSDVNPASAA